jgi:O-antigen/teichoic acid export membrane protein
MAGNLLYGLLCVRLLPSAEYAKFVVVFAVQGTIIALMDVNFTGTLVPLVGERIHDRKLIADYVASLRQLSYWAYGIVGSGLVLFYPFLVRNRGWSWQVVAAMVIILLASTWFMRISSAYGAVLILLRERSDWYKGQMISSLGTLALLLLLWMLHRLGPFSAILLNVAGIIFVGIFYQYRARRLLGVSGVVTPSKRKAIVRLALPNVPQAIFYALQGQLSLFLITYLGHTKGVASVGALARLGQLFAIFLQMNPLLTEPYFARLPKELLKKRYAIALLVAALASSAVALVACEFPQLFLWLLGPQYSTLQFEVKLAIATGAVSCFSGVLWSIHSARRFVYWWNVIFSMFLIVGVQALCVLELDMSTIRGVLLLNLATNLAYLFINVLSGAYGFLKGPREVERQTREMREKTLQADVSLEMNSLEHGDPIEYSMPDYAPHEVREQ